MVNESILKGFTDITLEICGKQCNFKHGIRNKDKKELAKKIGTDKFQEAYIESIKIQSDVEILNEKMELLKTQQKLYAEQNKPKKQSEVIEKLLELHDELRGKSKKLESLFDAYGLDIEEKMEEKLGETVEFYLTNITKDEFIDNCTIVDSAIAQHIGEVHTLCMMGEDEEKIKEVIEEKVTSFLEERGYNLNKGYKFDSV